jgi:hypothetical protein
MISTMCGKRVALLFLLLPALSALLMSRAWSRAAAANDPAQPLSQQQMQELIRNAADHDIENDQKQRDYTYTQREEERRLDGRGQVKSVQTKTSEIMELYGEQVARLVAKDDKPLSAKDAAKEEQKLQKLLDQRKNESAENRRKREDKGKKDREQDREFVGEVSDAYNFHLVGLATLEGRPTYILDAEPRPGYVPHLKGAKLLPKFRFRVWIDQQESQWKKLDIQCIDTVSFGLILARVHKGSRIVIEQRRVNDEVWLPEHVALKADVRVGLLKDFNVESDLSYSNYRKFHSDTKVIVGAEVPQPQ